MIILPAIDIKNGKCVRLKQGKFSEVKVYSEDVVKMAKKWSAKGCDYLHVVDLDGAKDGESKNFELINKIANEIDVPVQVGGGIRSQEIVDKFLNAGVNRVILGTIAIENIDFVKKMVEKYGDRIIISIDAKNGYVATKGWTEISKIKALDFINELKAVGIKTIVYTDILKDGMMNGPNFEIYEMLSKEIDINIIASGGISSVEDVKKIKGLGLYGCIVGKALYNGAVTLDELLEV